MRFITAAILSICLAMPGMAETRTDQVTLIEGADHVGIPIPGFGYVWVKNSTPATLMFTDDAGKDTHLTGQGVYNVKDYGAVGDGVEDDTAEIQAAITAAGSNAVVFFPPGTYDVSSTLTASNDTILFTGKGATIEQLTEETKTFTVTGDWVTFRDLHIKGVGTETPWAGASTSYNGTAAIYLSASYGTVENCRITNHAGGGILIWGNRSNIRIAGNTIIGTHGVNLISPNNNGSDAGIHTGGGTFTFDGVEITGNDISRHAFGIIFAGNGTGLRITKNYVHDIHGQHAMYLTQGLDATIANNVIHTIPLKGINCQGQSEVDIDTTITVSGNSLADIGSTAIVAQQIESAYYYNNLAIVGNNIENTGSYAMFVSGAKGIVIAGNRVRNSADYGLWIRRADGSIIGNRFEQCDAAAIYAQNLTGRLALDAIHCVDSPINAGDDTTTETHRSVISIIGDAGGTESAQIGQISMGFERESENSGAGSLQNALYLESNLAVDMAGPVVNKTSVSNTYDASMTYTDFAVTNLDVIDSADPTIELQNTDTTIVAEQELASIEFHHNDASGFQGVAAEINTIAKNAGTQYGIAFSTLDAGNGLAEHMRLTYYGALVMGHTVRDGPGGNTKSSLEIHDAGDYDGGMGVMRWAADASGANYRGGKSRSATIGSHTIVNDNDEILAIIGNADDGVDLVSEVAEIRFEIDGTPGADVTPGAIVMSTTADGASTVTEALRIDSSQITRAVGGVKMGADSTDNLIDDASNGSGSATLYIGNETIDTSVSDRRAKKNIQPTTIDAIAFLEKLQVRDFEWRNGDHKGHRITGLIAQEVEKIAPQYVKQGESNDDMKAVEYQHLVPHLIAAIQQQQRQIDALRGKQANLPAIGVLGLVVLGGLCLVRRVRIR